MRPWILHRTGVCISGSHCWPGIVLNPLPTAFFLLSLFSSLEIPKLSSKVVNHAGQPHRRERAVSSPIYFASAMQSEGAPTRHEASMFLPTDNLNAQMTFVPGELISSLASVHESTKDKVIRSEPV